ncbi:Asp-tRNA(Asn)/Glu-tRNA(Gln) amidotransferase subunit GatB [Chloroflexota bacterium]
MNFETIIGLEVHAQLLTKTKMFCRCSADYASTPPNTHVCPVCLGMPGVLPTINQQAVEYTMLTAMALHCTISDYTKFDRKNYPYPDLMKGYQISQYDAPIGHHGWVNIEVNGLQKRVSLTRVHLEEDVAKLLHRVSPDTQSYSLVDVNRSGVPLMEVVSEPDLRSPEEAREYLVTLRSILQYLSVSTGNMEEGSFRCDANISVRPENSQESTAKVEVKNMNSFRAVFRAMEYEANRLRKAAAEGKRLVQETRGWVEEKGKTVSQRSKEYAHDYRYFPEPDLPPLVLNREWVEESKAKLPELPDARRDRFMDEYGLPRYDADLLTSSKLTADYFEDCMTRPPQSLSPKKHAKPVANWIIGEFSRLLNVTNTDTKDMERKVSPVALFDLVQLISQGVISGSSAKLVFEEMFRTGKEAEDIIKQRGLSQISDTQQIKSVLTEVLSANTGAVADYRNGKKETLKFLVGQAMKATKGQANPTLVNEELTKMLEDG